MNAGAPRWCAPWTWHCRTTWPMRRMPSGARSSPPPFAPPASPRTAPRGPLPATGFRSSAWRCPARSRTSFPAWSAWPCCARRPSAWTRWWTSFLRAPMHGPWPHRPRRSNRCVRWLPRRASAWSASRRARSASRTCWRRCPRVPAWTRTHRTRRWTSPAMHSNCSWPAATDCAPPAAPRSPARATTRARPRRADRGPRSACSSQTNVPWRST